jgi:hypothetical protein
MDRRKFLRRTSALGALTLAGCMADEEANGTTADTPGAGSDTDMTPAVTGWSIERTGNGCASGDSDYASTSTDDDTMTVTFSGRVTTGNPCYQPIFKRTAYDAEADSLTIALGTEAEEKACIDCVGYVDVSGTVEFEGSLPGDVEVVHGGETLTPASGAGDQSSGDSPTPQASSFSVTNIDSSSPERAADAEFDEDEGTIMVTGTIVGSDGCTTADLGAANYDAAADRLDVNVVTRTVDDAEDRVCTQQRVGIDYEATVSFENGIPSSVSVSHDGDGVMSAGYGSSSASAPDADDGTPDA